jgi:hypothetical protein
MLISLSNDLLPPPLIFSQNKEVVGSVVNPAELVRDLGFAETDGPLHQAWQNQQQAAPGGDAQHAIEEILSLTAE